MNIFKKLEPSNIFILVLCAIIIVVAEYLFLTGNQLHAIFVGLWVPTLLGIVIFIKQIINGR